MRKVRKIRYQGVLDTLYGHAKRLGLPEIRVYSRARRWGLKTQADRDRVFASGLYPNGMSVIVTYRGVTAPRHEHAKRLGISRMTIRERIRLYGADDYERLFAPVRERNVLIPDAQGRMATRVEHAARCGISYDALLARLERYHKGRIPYERVFLPYIESPKDDSWKMRLTYNGITDTVAGWAKRIGVEVTLLYARLTRLGRSEEVMGRVLAPRGRRVDNVFLTYRGETRTIAEWARRTGHTPFAIRDRLKKGATPAQALQRGSWNATKGARVQEAHGNHTRRKLAALGIFA